MFYFGITANPVHCTISLLTFRTYSLVGWNRAPGDLMQKKM